MITYEFFFPIEPKYLPVLRVVKQPLCRVTYSASEYTASDEIDIDIKELGFHPMTLIHLCNYTGFISELEQAAKEHYKDVERESYLNKRLNGYK